MDALFQLAKKLKTKHSPVESKYSHMKDLLATSKDDDAWSEARIGKCWVDKMHGAKEKLKCALTSFSSEFLAGGVDQKALKEKYADDPAQLQVDLQELLRSDTTIDELQKACAKVMKMQEAAVSS